MIPYIRLETKRVVRSGIKEHRTLYPQTRKALNILITYGQPVTKLVRYTIEGALILEKHCDKGAKKLVDSFGLQAK